MHQDVKTLVRSLSNLVSWYFEAGEPAPVSGATIELDGRLVFETPGLGDDTPRPRQIERLESTLKSAARTGTCRACAMAREVSVRDHTGALSQALQISVETSDGAALDVFLPFVESDQGLALDRTQVYSVPGVARAFAERPPEAPAPRLPSSEQALPESARQVDDLQNENRQTATLQTATPQTTEATASEPRVPEPRVPVPADASTELLSELAEMIEDFPLAIEEPPPEPVPAVRDSAAAATEPQPVESEWEPELVSMPVESGWEPERVEVASSDVQSRLLAAAAIGDVAGLDRALAEGADLDAPLLDETAVQVALRAGDAEALDWLLAKGAAAPRLGIREWQELSQPARQSLLDVLHRRGHRAPVWLRAVQGFTQLGGPRRNRDKAAGPWSALQRYRDPNASPPHG